MAKSYRLSPLAVTDLEDIWLYTLTQWSRGQADSYHYDFIKTFQDLAAGTKIGLLTVLPDFQKYFCGSHVKPLKVCPSPATDNHDFSRDWGHAIVSLVLTLNRG